MTKLQSFPFIETWSEMTKRHKHEKLRVLRRLARARLTQSEAAGLLDMQLTALNNVVHRNGVYWPVGRQGRPQRARAEVLRILQMQEQAND